MTRMANRERNQPEKEARMWNFPRSPKEALMSIGRDRVYTALADTNMYRQSEYLGRAQLGHRERMRFILQRQVPDERKFIDWNRTKLFPFDL